MKILKPTEQSHPFYKPLWRRIAIVVSIALWLGFELYTGGSGLWIALSAGMLAYAVWTFLISFPKDDGGPAS